MPRDTEHILQRQCVTWFRYQFPLIDPLLFAIPNGGGRSKATAGRLKAEGVKAGVSDLFLSVARKGVHGLFVEMKAISGRQSGPQKVFEQRVCAEGYGYVVIRSLEDFQQTITDYLK